MDRRSMLALLGAGAVTAMTEAATTPATDAEGAPIAATTAGQVRGYLKGKTRVFKGIPYAASTAGSGRFMPPRKAVPWKGIREATQLAERSPQNPTPGLLPEEAVSVSQEPMSEDCLHLNVWTPALRDGGKRPVMVWFHGGGYSVGSGGNERYDGENLCTRQDVVLITINHRLNVFGYLYLGDLAGKGFADSGNAGMLDCVAALEWIRDNITEFGGDPGNVTLFGESGGGGKVMTLMAMPAAKGLFHRVIAQSGLSLRQASREDATKVAAAVLKQLGLEPTQTKELQRLPQQTLLDAIARLSPAPRFTPVVDGHTLPSHPFDPKAPSLSENVPLMIGSNATEITFLEETPLDEIDDAALLDHVKRYTRIDATEAAELVALYRKRRPSVSNVHLYQLIASDYWFTVDVATVAVRKAEAGKAPVFVYRFEKETPVRDGKLRSVHSLEIPYVFDTLDVSEAVTGKEADRYPIAMQMSRAWATFARNGDPNYLGLPVWPPYRADRRDVIVFDNLCRVLKDPYREERLAIAAIKAKQGAPVS
jgi:para-nitrobenzyl esterase